jgi:hypothetical protein
MYEIIWTIYLRYIHGFSDESEYTHSIPKVETKKYLDLTITHVLN